MAAPTAQVIRSTAGAYRTEDDAASASMASLESSGSDRNVHVGEAARRYFFRIRPSPPSLAGKRLGEARRLPRRNARWTSA